MGIHLPLHSVTVPDWWNRPYEPETEGYEDDKAELEEELRAGAVKVNDFLRDGVMSQLNTILAKDNREFTNEMLGRRGESRKAVLDVRA